MKFLSYILLIIAIVLIAINATQLNFANLFEGDSEVAIIGVLAALCVILLFLILRISHRIAKKKK